MVKYLVVLLVIVLVVWLLRRDRAAAPAEAARARAPSRRLPQPMVPCAHCGVHLPAAEAVAGDGGHHYCSEEHRRAGPRAAAGR